MFSGLRARILGLVAVALTPALLAVVLDARYQFEHDREHALGEITRIVTLAEADQRAIIDAATRFLATVARLDAVRAGTPSLCSATLRSLLANSPSYSSAGVAGPAGDVICSSVALDAGVNLSDRPYFQASIEGREAVSTYVFGRLTGRPLIVVSTPVVLDADVVGVAFLGLSLAWLEQIQVANLVPEGAVVRLVDPDGHLMTRLPHVADVAGSDVSDDPIVARAWTVNPSANPSTANASTAAGRGVATGETVDAGGGGGYLYAHAPLLAGEHYVGSVIAHIPTSLAYADARRNLLRNLVVLLVVAVAGVAFARLINERLVMRPVAALLMATERVARGNLDVRVGESAVSSELGELARSFDAMAASLEEQWRQRDAAEAERGTYQDRLELQAAALEAAANGIVITDVEGTVEWVNPAFTALTGYARDEAVGRNPGELVRSGVHDDEFYRQMWSTILDGRVWYGEVTNRRKDGRLYVEEQTITPVRNAGGELTRFVAIKQDVTARRRHEREREAVFQLADAFRTATMPKDAARHLLDAGRRSFEVESGMVVLRDPVDGSVEVAAASGAVAGGDRRLVLEDGTTLDLLGSTAARTWEGVVVIPRDAGTRDAVTLPSVVTAPLRSEEGIVGAWLLARDNASRATPFTQEDAAVLQAMGELAGATLRRMQLHQHALRRLQHVEALRNIDLAITSSLDPRMTLRVLLDEVTRHLGASAASVLLLNEPSQELRYAQGRGFRTHLVEETNVRLGSGLAGQAALERRVVESDDVGEDPAFERKALIREEGFRVYHAAPMVARGRVLGVLEVFQDERVPLHEEWLSFLEALAGQAAIAVENSRLFADLERSNTELRLAYDATIEGWARALDLRDEETEGHSRRVTDLTVRLARALGVPETEIVHVRRGALLHDIGKLGVPDAILHKPGPLTDEEWAIMRTHPVLAVQMLSSIRYLQPALEIPHAHHEKWDGTGYPRGLVGEEIPMAARIFAVVDVYDALSSDRPYRGAWPHGKIVAYLRDQRGKHFDPVIAEALLEVVAGGAGGDL
ncbi:MAG: PAS domain S-box protein [Trueperaceae bacterium]